MSMNLIHNLLNFVLPVLPIILLVLLCPLVLLFRVFKCFLRFFFPEKLAGKVALITGASSGIGEYLAYEYAKQGACLALVARRKEQLEVVAGRARELGSPDVIVISADVSNVDDCKRFVDETVNHFGTLDHLVNNAGVCYLQEDQEYSPDYVSLMDINFWGSVYTAQFALPHLRKSKGKIIVISSCAGWLTMPRLCIYGASKAALINFYETLRVEVGSDIGITIVTPGIIESGITDDEWLSKLVPGWDLNKNKSVVWDARFQCELGFWTFMTVTAELYISIYIRHDITADKPKMGSDGCDGRMCRTIVNSIRRGDAYLTEPQWVRVLFWWKTLYPEVLTPIARFLFITYSKGYLKNRKSRLLEKVNVE